MCHKKREIIESRDHNNFREHSGDKNVCKISGYEEDYRPERPMVQRQLSEAPSVSGGHRESSRMGLGIGYTAYQSGYNKLFTQVRPLLSLSTTTTTPSH